MSQSQGSQGSLCRRKRVLIMTRRAVAVTVLMVCVLVRPADAVMTLQGSDGATLHAYRISNMLYWSLNGNTTTPPLRLLSLQANASLFDWCDLSSYTRGGIAPLLAAHGMNSSTPYIAVFERLMSQCGYGGYWTSRSIDTFGFEKFLPERQSIIFEGIGAAAVLTDTKMASPFNIFRDGIDYHSGLVDGQQSRVAVMGLHYPSFEAMMRTYRIETNQLYASLTADPNPADEVHSRNTLLFKIFVFFAFIFFTLALTALYLLYLNCLPSPKNRPHNPFNKDYRTLLILLVMGQLICLVPLFLDPAALYNVMPTAVAFGAVNGYALFNWLTSLSFLLLWVDIKKSLVANRYRAPIIATAYYIHRQVALLCVVVLAMSVVIFILDVQKVTPIVSNLRYVNTVYFNILMVGLVSVVSIVYIVCYERGSISLEHLTLTKEEEPTLREREGKGFEASRYETVNSSKAAGGDGGGHLRKDVSILQSSSLEEVREGSAICTTDVDSLAEKDLEFQTLLRGEIRSVGVSGSVCEEESSIEGGSDIVAKEIQAMRDGDTCAVHSEGIQLLPVSAVSAAGNRYGGHYASSSKAKPPVTSRSLLRRMEFTGRKRRDMESIEKKLKKIRRVLLSWAVLSIVSIAGSLGTNTMFSFLYIWLWRSVAFNLVMSHMVAFAILMGVSGCINAVGFLYVLWGLVLVDN